MENNSIGYITKIFGLLSIIFTSIISSFMLIMVVILVLASSYFYDLALLLSPIIILLVLILWQSICAYKIGKNNDTFRVGVSIVWFILIPIAGIAYLIDSASHRNR